jgi:hypothetical protein
MGRGRRGGMQHLKHVEGRNRSNAREPQLRTGPRRGSRASAADRRPEGGCSPGSGRQTIATITTAQRALPCALTRSRSPSAGQQAPAVRVLGARARRAPTGRSAASTRTSLASPLRAASPTEVSSTFTSPRRSPPWPRGVRGRAPRPSRPGCVRCRTRRAAPPDDQGESLFVVLAFTGLRMGEPFELD